MSILLVVVLIYVWGPLESHQETMPEYSGVRKIPAVFGQTEDQEGKKDQDSAFISLLKNLQGVMDGWLKSLNERIESEDITQLEVRFWEILRSMLEWVKEKIDAKVGPPPQKAEGQVAYFRMHPKFLSQPGEG